MDENWQGSVEIDAPIDQVYAYLADFPNHCEWAQTLERMELTKPGSSEGVGAVYKTYERQANQSDRAPKGALPEKAFKAMTKCEVTELKPNTRIAWRAHPLPVSMGIHAELAFELQPNDRDGTHLSQRIRFHQSWFAYNILRPLMFRMKPAKLDAKGRAQWQASLDNIKTIFEPPSSA